mmetsp:Transcript_29950/g.51784  ORF Transcript_29950/g.51784 Transcript_29950/m.51784 type:complete len:192 (-) Transcript_29950:61-636(-)
MYQTSPLFESSPRQTNYKLFMADISQVCDGRTLMQFDHEKSVRVRPTSKRSDDGKVIQSINRIRLHRPVRAKNTRHAPFENQTSQGDQQSSQGNNISEPICDNELLSSTDSGSSSDRVVIPKCVLRQKYQPLHHNTSLNQAILSIMRPSRYSNISVDSLCSTSDVTIRRNDSWVPLGVDFSANMEVYVYGK